ncbi:MAG: membrane protein insertase YidC [Gammaproteobacteria bacterium 39-13]|nr:membrane protein insertase YidC [Gammaproteobacteria bacterium]OJV90708.1 MAG: membrane protein insertase YidC [Gammaproteobacteria bacterium 39-13]
MELQRTRLFLLISLLVVGLALFSAWQQEHPVVSTKAEETLGKTSQETKGESDIPNVSMGTPTTLTPVTQTVSADLINIHTDVLNVKIDPRGGDIVRAELVKYPLELNAPDKGGVVLLDRSEQRDYIAQSGLIGKDERGPDSRQAGRAHYSVEQKEYSLGHQQQLDVNLHWLGHSGVKVTKTYTFKPGSYLVDVSYKIHNPTDAPWLGSFYGQIQREHTKEKSSGMLGVQMYQGAAAFTEAKPFKKITYQDMKKAPFKEQLQGGWVAQLEHYFLCAFIPNADTNNSFYTRVDNENIYNIGGVTPVEVAPQSTQEIKGNFYVGPEIADTLKQISPGLNLTIDYGILWPISQLLFWLLKTINSYVGNWGWSIILVTLVIKVLFYKLSASSYRSMGKMRLLQPRIELLKERHKDDKQQFSTALMELYRKEKMNPLGGCLPILIQIPVFIALYYVLLESVELRHAPFMFWIQDLSSKDPYYVLPLIMGATMFLQQRMNPAPPDPVQAKVMMLMPVVFTVLFLSFPSGLVLYWTVNNLLSIAQQWFITRSLATDGKASKKVK